MLIPKAAHLVERVVDQLLQTGKLDNSSARMLRKPSVLLTDAPASASIVAEPTLVSILPANTGPGSTPSHVLLAVEPNQADDDVPPRVPPYSKKNNDAPLRASMPSFRKLRQSFRHSPETITPGSSMAQDGIAAALSDGSFIVDAVALECAGMIDMSRTRTRISEEFRLVQRQILRLAFGPGAEPGFSNLLLVTSARPGEGKSFMSTNLSSSIARQGDHQVLLVDADSKRDSICYAIGLGQARGLLDLAAQPMLDPALLIVKTTIERLSILPVGRERERSGELFSAQNMTRLIRNLGRRYADRLLILDAPPCLSTSDPALMAQVVGQILFVVEANRTQREEIEASLDLIQACPTITMVLNKQQTSSRYIFGSYSSYYSSGAE